jgi:hypothetical protein
MIVTEQKSYCMNEERELLLCVVTSTDRLNARRRHRRPAVRAHVERTAPKLKRDEKGHRPHTGLCLIRTAAALFYQSYYSILKWIRKENLSRMG